MTSGRAEARRLTSAGLADLVDRQAEAVAALDRALETRLGELDRAFATRQTRLESARLEAEHTLVEQIEQGAAELKRAAGSERRLLQEAAAAALADLEAAAVRFRRELEEVAADRSAALQELLTRVQDLERAVAERIRALEELAGWRGGPSGPG